MSKEYMHPVLVKGKEPDYAFLANRAEKQMETVLTALGAYFGR
jgi:hypothetical protein